MFQTSKIGEQGNFNVAIYCRLSRDDGQDSESLSIQNQKETLVKYCNERNWHIKNIYVDDGYSGTNFDRPGFKKMIADINYGKINCVITKDLSRLGRNYIEVGHYQEEFFPSKNVRYIAVNDNYDSFDENNDFLGPFKNIINEYYAKDISKKIKFTLRSKAERGEARKTTIPLYGYMYNEAGERIPDPETAPIVQKIFEYYLKYQSLNEIERKLREERLFCPGYYLYLKYNYNSPKYLDSTEEQKYEWRDTFIRTIIKNPEYLGHYITQKTYKNNFKVKKKQMNDSPFVFENKFEPLVSKEVFEKAQRIRMVNTNLKEPIEENTYKKICYCGNCGKPLSFMRRRDRNTDASKYRYVCRNKDCAHKSYINKVVLDELLRKEIESLISYVLKHKTKFLEYAKNLNSGLTTSNQTFALKERSRLIDIKSNLEKQLSRAKDLYIMKDLELEDYNKYKTDIYKKIDTINKNIDAIKIEVIDSRDYEKDAKELLKVLKNLSTLDALDSQVLEAIIEKIVIHTEKNKAGISVGASIEIYYPKINDILGGFLNESNSKK